MVTCAVSTANDKPPAPPQALYLCLTGINIKYPLDNVLVSVSDASVLVDRAEHYKYAISRLSRADTAVISFPCKPRNEPPLADLLDLGLRERQRFTQPAAHVEGHCVVSATCFSCRGPELFNALRAMELENAGSRTFDWLPFFIHLDASNAKSASYDVDAPACSVLVHKHGAPESLLLPLRVGIVCFTFVSSCANSATRHTLSLTVAIHEIAEASVEVSESSVFHLCGTVQLLQTIQPRGGCMRLLYRRTTLFK